jgi:hypothetical protein
LAHLPPGVSMAEYTRAFSVEIHRDTNKDTYRSRHESPLPAILELIPLLTDRGKQAVIKACAEEWEDE